MVLGVLSRCGIRYVAVLNLVMSLIPSSSSRSRLASMQTNSSRGVYATLLGHKGEVTTIKPVHERGGKTTFISGDSHGEIRIWQQGEGKEVRGLT